MENVQSPQELNALSKRHSSHHFFVAPILLSHASVMSSGYQSRGETPPPTNGNEGRSFYKSLMDGSVEVGTLFGVPICIHNLFPLFIVVTTIIGFIPPASTESGLLNFVVLGPILFTTVLIHEGGHCWATKLVGGDVHKILLWPLGGLAYVGHSGDAADDLKVSIAGPLTHIPQCLFWVIALAMGAGSVNLTYTGDFATDMCRAAVIMNIQLALFNLFVPAFPLDGGRIFADSMLLCGVPAVRAAGIMVGTSTVFGIAIVALGFYFGQFITIFVGGWVLTQAVDLGKLVKSGMVHEHPLFAKYANVGDGERGGIAGALGGSSGRV